MQTRIARTLLPCASNSGENTPMPSWPRAISWRARQLLREKRRFRAQERRLAHAHVSRLQRKIVQSLETSSLHLELIADMKRLNSLFCSSAYVVLETSDTGALSAEDIADITHSP